MTARKVLYWSLLIWLVFLCLLREWGFTEKWSRRWKLWGSSYDSDTSDEDEDGPTRKGRYSVKLPRFPWPQKPRRLVVPFCLVGSISGVGGVAPGVFLIGGSLLWVVGAFLWACVRRGHGRDLLECIQVWLQRGLLEVVPGCAGLVLLLDWRLSVVLGVGGVASGLVWVWYTARYPDSWCGCFAQQNKRGQEAVYRSYCQYFYPFLWVFRSGVVVGLATVVCFYCGVSLVVTYGLLGYYLITTAVHLVVVCYSIPAAQRRERHQKLD